MPKLCNGDIARWYTGKMPKNKKMQEWQDGFELFISHYISELMDQCSNFVHQQGFAGICFRFLVSYQCIGLTFRSGKIRLRTRGERERTFHEHLINPATPANRDLGRVRE